MKQPVDLSQTDIPDIGVKNKYKWQLKLLPFMLLMLGSLTILSFATSIFQFNRLNERLENMPRINLKEDIFGGINSLDIKTDSQLKYLRLKTESHLEKSIIEYRYYQANILLLSRIWTTYQGFIIGMVIALVGSAFILGKLQDEKSTNLTGKSNDAIGGELTLTSSSPGLILVFLGTVLMLASLFTGREVKVMDTPLYFNSDSSVPIDKNTEISPPKDLENLDLEEKKLLDKLKNNN
jgi:hypothetical protein